MVLKLGNEGNFLESIRLFVGCSSDFGIVKEEGELFFMELLSGGGSCFEKENFIDVVFEFSEIRVR